MHAALGGVSPSGENSPQNKMAEGKNAFNVLLKFLPFFLLAPKSEIEKLKTKK
jgi:hypothetical protein